MGFQGQARVCWAAGREFLAEQTLETKTHEKEEGVTFGRASLGTQLVGWRLTWRDCRCWVQGLAHFAIGSPLRAQSRLCPPAL